MIIRELLAKIGFEVDEHPLHKAEELLEGIKERLEIFAGIEATKKLYEVSEKFAEWGEHLHVTAQNMGLNVEELQLLSQAALRSGVSQDEMSHGLAILSRHLYEAKQGSQEAAGAFYKIGISATQIRGFQNAQQALLAVSDRLAKMESPIERMAVAQTLFGRGAYQMTAFLSKGSAAINEQIHAAEKLGLTLSEHQVESLVEAQHSFLKFHGILKNIAATIAATIAPAFTVLVDKFAEFYSANKTIIQANIYNWLLDVAFGMGFVYGLVTSLITRIRELGKALGIDEKNILGYIGKLAGFAGAITALSVAFRIVSGIFATLSPFSAFALTIGAIALAVHDLWAVFNDQPTWTGGILDWAANLKIVKEYIGDIRDAAGHLDFSKFGEGLGKAFDKFKDKAMDIFSDENMQKLNKSLENLFTTENATKFGDIVANALKSGLTLTNFIWDFCFTVAGAVMSAIWNAVAKKFPGLGLDTAGEPPSEEQEKKNKAYLESKKGAKDFDIDKADSEGMLSGLAERVKNFANDLTNGTLATKALSALPSPTGLTSAGAAAGGTHNVSNTHTYNVTNNFPSGANAKENAAAFHKSIEDKQSEQLRKAKRDLTAVRVK